ncbi:MAG: hypothetical protein H6R21_1379, partial [Proteobacteria bacterium]|nr:hypothetical protein [Pseudomonadota bacterium]
MNKFNMLAIAAAAAITAGPV